MSKLIVEVCKIAEVINHPNADKLDILTVKGWKCIVGRNQYHSGELVIYCPPDSIIPPDLVEKYKLEFLKKNGKVGSIKLRGELSQGLILDIPTPMGDSWKEGLDVALMMGITKYEPPEPEYSLKTGQVAKKNKHNPNFSKYTDIENINNFDKIFEEGEEVVISEKIHGCNFRAAHLPIVPTNLWDWVRYLFGQRYEFIYGSRGVQKKWTNIHKGFYKEDVWGKIVNRYNMKEWMPKDYTIYGEIYGDGIQDLTYGLKGDINLFIFDVKYKDKYLNFNEFIKFNRECLELHGINHVPILFLGNYADGLRIEMSKGNSIIYHSQIREGCVIKPLIERENRCLGRVILKSINPDYLTRKSGTEFK